jgi:hypothetical protein
MNVGGPIPLIQAGRDRHMTESTWWVQITWLRVRVRMEVTR